MKDLFYWLIGDRAGRTILAVWNWLWGKPVESGGKIAVEVAQESLWSMQQSVHQLAESVSKVMAAYEKAKQQYQQKQSEFKHAESQAALAHRQGNESAARLAMTRAIEIERILPQFESQVLQAETTVTQLKEKLDRERQKLESYQIQMQNMKALAEVNDALSVISKVHGDLKVDSARNQFNEAKSAIESRNLQTQAFAELSEDLSQKLQADLDRMTIDDEITRRLQTLNAGEN
jgi:phage shock protein A